MNFLSLPGERDYNLNINIMKKQVQQVEDFHKKFRAPVWEKPQNIPKDRYDLRHQLTIDEVNEYLEWAQKWDVQNVAKELCDILYLVYWTIVEHGLQDKIEECFDEVHRSHMTKDYSPGKMIKWEGFVEADLSKII